VTSIDAASAARRLGVALRRAPLWVEVGVIVAFYVGYAIVQGAAPTDADEATAHGLAIWQLEQEVGLAPEHWLNQLAVNNVVVAQLAGWFYGIAHFVLTPVVLGWLYLCRAHLYGRWRTTLAIASLVALAVYWVYPVAPPRLLDTVGLQDVLVEHNILSAADPHGPSAFVNLYAAMPSLHVAWATWCALAVRATVTGHRILTRLVWLYPVMTSLVVFVTANHYLLDAVAGALLMIAVALVVEWFAGLESRRQARHEGRHVDGQPARLFPQHQVARVLIDDEARAGDGRGESVLIRPRQ
jgi:hypothetical protein